MAAVFYEKMHFFEEYEFFLILGVDGVCGWGVEAASPRRSGLGGFRKIC